MPTSINNNFLANNAANSMKGHYARLAASTQKLSSGLRVNSAADDAAGLAIRELQRADIAALNQGSRNANDAISLIQVADGALAIIDEKLIRMKELAEQAATGTYNDTQRRMIDSEFQAMAEEINRIAAATDFNGIHLLDGSLKRAHDGSGLNARGQLKIHFGSGNDSAEDYYYVGIPDCSTRGLGLVDGNGKMQKPEKYSGLEWLKDVDINPDGTISFNFTNTSGAGEANDAPIEGFDYYKFPLGLKDIVMNSTDARGSFYHKAHICLFMTDGRQLTGPAIGKPWDGQADSSAWWNNNDGAAIIQGAAAYEVFKEGAAYNGDRAMTDAGDSMTIDTSTDPRRKDEMTIEMLTSMNETVGSIEKIGISEVKKGLVFFIGGHKNGGTCNNYTLSLTAGADDELLDAIERFKAGDPDVEFRTEPPELLGIESQEKAQKALVTIDNAIVSKDTIRAHLGALQNRLENTLTNLTIQSENLQAAESRISDLDVAQEMAAFVRNQVLTQSAVAMLAQANSSPQMLAQLING